MEELKNKHNITFHDIKQRILRLNQLAMDSLNLKDFSGALKSLQKADSILSKISPSSISKKLLAITYNNLGCLYKNLNESSKALTYLTKSLIFESQASKNNINLASTHLNISSIESQLNNHQDSLHHSEKAILLLTSSLSAAVNSQEYIKTLIAAYQQAGTSSFYLKNFKVCKVYMNHALDFATRHLGSDHNLVKSVKAHIKKLENDKIDVKNAHKLSKQSKESYDKNINWPKCVENIAWPSRIKSYEKGKNNADSIWEFFRKFEEPCMPRVNSRLLLKHKSERTAFTNSDNKLDKHRIIKNASKIRFGSSNPRLNSSSVKAKLVKYIQSPYERSSSFNTLKLSKGNSIKAIRKSVKTKKSLRAQSRAPRRETPLLIPTEKPLSGLDPLSPTFTLQHQFHLFRSQNPRNLRAFSKSPPKPKKSLIQIIQLIQAHIRGFLAKTLLKNSINAAIKIQNAFRQYRVRTIYLKVISAVIFIQAAFRGYLVRKALNVGRANIKFKSKKYWQ